MKKDNKIKILTITLITAIIMAVSSITIYSNVCAPKFYDYFIDTGVKYLTDGKYEEAILAFNKAIEIEEKSTEARVYLAQGYIGNNEYDNAIDVLEEAQNLDITSEELLIDILEILNEINPEIIEEFLNRFINSIGKDNLSETIKEILATVNESPNIPILDPKPGTYIDDISLRLNLDKIKVGHTYYYTTDGSEPTKESNKYIGKIDISSSTIIKLIGYNKNDESTEVMTLEYIIDKEIIKNIHNTLSESEKLAENTKVGTDIGNTTEEAKKEFKVSISKVKKSLNKNSISYNEAKNMNIEIESALKTFKDNIIEPTDKSKLQSAINKAQNLYNSSIEGSKDGQFKVGSKVALQKAIDEAKKINDSITSSQEKIDNAKLTLNNAINKFENSKISNFTKEKALQYLKNKYGEELTHDDTGKVGFMGYMIFDENLYIENGRRYYNICMNYYSTRDTNNQLNRVHQLTCGCGYPDYKYGICEADCYFKVYENGDIKMTEIAYDA